VERPDGCHPVTTESSQHVRIDGKKLPLDQVEDFQATIKKGVM